MYHSIYFAESKEGKNARNTWSSWYLIPSARPHVAPPQVKTSYIDIPGTDGALDVTELLTGKARYSDRSGSWSFYLENGHGEWSDRYSEIMGYLHGKSLYMWFEDDPLFYYIGRFAVNQWASGSWNSSITINYVLEPHKYFRYGVGELWLWDPFDFENGVITDYKNMVVNENSTLGINIVWDMADAVPEIVVHTNSNLILTSDGVSHKLKKGSNVIDDFIITEGTNSFSITNIDHEQRAMFSIKITGGVL